MYVSPCIACVVKPYLAGEPERAVKSRVFLSLVSVVLRMFARLRRRVGFGIDDYLSVASIVLLIAMLIELILCE